jgi:hypothetical protein
MLDAIGESTARMMVRTESNLAMGSSETSIHKIEKKAQERPVESPKESAGSDAETDFDKRKGNYKMDEEGVYFEKYDEKGHVIFRAPPEKRPIDEHV